VSFSKDMFAVTKMFYDHYYGTFFLANTSHSGLVVSIQDSPSFFIKKELTSSHNELVAIIQKIAELTNPCLVKLRGIILPSESIQQCYRLVFDYYQRETLFNITNKDFNRFNEIEWDSTRKMITIIGLAHSLRFLHGKGIYHNHLSSDCVFFDTKFEPILGHYMYSSLMAFSIPYYMVNNNYRYTAPEVFFGEPNGPKPDVFSFAMIVYEILTGKIPFRKCRNQKEVLQKIRSGERPGLKSGYFERWSVLLNKCWAENPSLRPSFDEIFAEITSFKSYQLLDYNNEDFLNYLQHIGVNIGSIYSGTEQNKDSIEVLIHRAKYLEKSSSMQDQKEAALSYFKATLSGHPEAQYHFAMKLIDGKGVNQDIPKAIKYLKESSSRGYSQATHELLLLLEKEQMIEEVQQFLTKSISEGDLSKKVLLAHFVAQYNPAEARKILDECVTQNIAKSKLSLGKMIINGIVPGTKEEALELLHQESLCDDLDNSYAYAEALLKSESTKNQALTILIKLAQSNHISSMIKLSEYVAPIESELLILKAAELGSPYANFLLSDRVHSSDDTHKLLKLAADSGDMLAQFKYGLYLSEGIVKRNLKDSVKYLKLSADQGNVDAMCRFAFACQTGFGVAKRPDIANFYLQKVKQNRGFSN